MVSYQGSTVTNVYCASLNNRTVKHITSNCGVNKLCYIKKHVPLFILHVAKQVSLQEKLNMQIYQIERVCSSEG